MYGNRYCKFSPAWTLDTFIVHVIVLLLLVDTIALYISIIDVILPVVCCNKT